MKESGIDWIGQIPQGWGVKAIKYIFDEIGSGSTPKSDNEIFYDGDINWIQSGDLYQTDTVTSVSKTISYQGFKSTSALKIYKHPFIALAMYGASVGNVAISCIDACVNQAVVVMLGTSETVRFGKYAIEASKNNLIFSAQGGTQPNISQSLIKNWNIPQPDSLEQTKIADFLDKKTTQLDKVKSLLEEQIQKLKDYRASLIYETVTKGLDKTVSMKDSGIDWIGQVPEGWGVSRLKYFFDIYAGGDIDERNTVDEYSENHPYPVISNSLENEGILGYTNNFRFQGDSVTVTGRGDVGKAVYRNIEFYPVVRLLVCIPKKQVDCRFVTYWINSAIIEKNQTAVSQLTIQMLGELIFTKVPYVEQKKIADFLDEKTIQIDKLIQIKNEQIKNINKQRQTLIYDYVTGKRRVY